MDNARAISEIEDTSWLSPDSRQNDLRRHLNTLRHRGWLIIATVVLALLVAIVYVETATPVYQAQSNLLVSAIASGTTVPANIPGLLYASADPTRDIQTAANVVNSIQTAKRAKDSLGLKSPAARILADISVQPVSNSNVLAVIGKASSPTAAANLANAFAAATIALRTERFKAAIDRQIAGLKAQIAASPAGSSTATSANGGTVSLNAQLAQLQTLSSGSLPDMSVSAAALPPTGRTSPRITLSLAAAIIVGLVLGILALLGWEALDFTLRREDQLRDVMRLPILARIPMDRTRTGHFAWLRSLPLLRRPTKPRTPDTFSFATLESFRTLRAMLLASRTPGQPAPRILLVTSAAPGEGKTTTALNVANSLAASGSKVVLIEGDLRRPSIGKALDLLSAYDVTSVLTGQVELSRALVTSKRYPNIRFLLAEGMASQATYGGDALFLPSVQQMLHDSSRLADFVVVDSPPLLSVIDALELARVADSVLLVTQLGRTDIRRLRALGALLAEAHIEPAGIAMIGADLPGGLEPYDYHYEQPVTSAHGGTRNGAAAGSVASPGEGNRPTRVRDLEVRRMGDGA